MHAKLKTIGLFILIGTLAACASPVRVTSDFDRATNFDRYKTYSFISNNPLLVADATATSPLLQGRLMTASRRELDRKGFRYTEDRAAADFVVGFTVGARDKIRVTNYPTAYRGTYYGRGWGGAYYNDVSVRNYTEGTVAIDVYDVRQKGAVWHGWAVKSITAAVRENPEPVINEVVGAILAEFPPSPGGGDVVLNPRNEG